MCCDAVGRDRELTERNALVAGRNAFVREYLESARFKFRDYQPEQVSVEEHAAGKYNTVKTRVKFTSSLTHHNTCACNILVKYSGAEGNRHVVWCMTSGRYSIFIK